MRVITWNVNSFNVRASQVERLLLEKSPDLLLLQETKKERIDPNLFKSQGYVIYHAGGKGRNGVAIITKEPLTEVRVGFQGFDEEDPQARERIIGGRWRDIFVFSIYVPNGSPVDSDYFYYKIQFIFKLREYLERYFDPQDKVLLGGDFNVAPDPIDVYAPVLLDGQVCFHERERKALKYLLDWGLYDALRVIHPNSKGLYTWWDYQFSALKRNLGMRLDHIFITEPLRKIIKSVEIDLKTRALPKPSDHAPLIVDFWD